jgi:pimeloyl-ACP methyl ester carboxylesterase
LEKVILVAHSGSGCLLELIADRIIDKVKGLIFISANIPPRGKRTIDVFPFFLKWMNLLSVKLAPGGFHLSSKQREKMIRRYFCNCCSGEIIEFVLKHPEKIEPPAVVTERIFRPELKNLPKIFIKLSKDNTATLEFQERMIKNLGGAEEYLIESDHMVMLSRPKELAGILNIEGERFFGV